jgi:putative membrane protein
VTVLERVGCRPLSWTALAGAVTLVLGLTGVAGLFVAAVATAIGLVPVLHGSRRMNALGVILLPLALNLSGVGPDVARFLGLAPAGR